MADRTYDFIDQGYDLAFHTKQLRDSSVKVRKVATLPFVLCASPVYLKRRHAVTRADRSCHAPLPGASQRPGMAFHQDGRTQHYKVPSGGFSSNTYLVLNKAVLEGLGIALLPLRPIFDDIRRGRLAVVLPEYEVPSRPLYVVYPPGLQSVKKFRVFLDYTADWFKRFPIDRPVTLESTNGSTNGVAAGTAARYRRPMQKPQRNVATEALGGRRSSGSLPSQGEGLHGRSAG